MIIKDIFNESKNTLKLKAEDLASLKEKIDIFNPVNTLKLGYSVTRGPDGRAIKGISQVKLGDDLTSQFSDGTIFSKVAGKEKKLG
ncbi:MAG: hypothetical protein KKH83_04415 [Candidatus Margulisbacteria bacterium]|nr:hypothetical protein [Candidatus Margulisiibacteriota bacterium]